jgi:hypothetical protein
VRNTASNGIAMSVENFSASSSDNTLLVSTQGTGDIVSFDSYHGTGSWDREFKFTNSGDGRCDGSWIGGGADYAEFFKLADVDEVIKPGDVIAMSPTIGYSVEKASASKNQLVLGVYSTNPVVVGNSSAEEDPKNAVLVGLMGVVPTHVCAENGAIHIGDFVTASSIEGVAAKAISSGMVIGRAMEDYTAATPGLIKVMVDVGYADLDNAGETESLRAEVQELKVLVEKLAGQQ